jgi:predicted dienelactone hydrolase
MLLRNSIAIAAMIACLTSAAAQEYEQERYVVGETQRAFDPEVARNWRGARTQRLVTMLWYPAESGLAGQSRDIGPPGQPVFHGHPAALNAPLSASARQYPLILLSHGTGGSAASLDWLASNLAAHGYIVAGVDHPGNNALEPLTREGFALWWERATDLSEVLDGMLADPVFGARIDATRIGAAGFSLGGYTVLELAGARTNRAAFDRFCHSTAADAVCRPAEMSQLGTGAAPAANALTSPEDQASLAKAGASYRDERIKAVFAIAPALGEAFDSSSIAGIEIPVALVAGTADTTVPPATNVVRVAGLLRVANVEMVLGASHNTFLDTCFPEAVERLPALCKDGPGVDRDAIHARTAQRASSFFDRVLR